MGFSPVKVMPLTKPLAAQFRDAISSDALAIAEVHVACWQAAYAELMPASFLSGLSVEKRADMWRQTLSRGALRLELAYVEQSLAGWIAYGSCRDADKNASWGEIVAINLHPARFRQGIGTLLMQRACDSLAAKGYSQSSLWTLTDNSRARCFYECLGFVSDGQTKEIDIAGRRLSEMRYQKPLVRES